MAEDTKADPLEKTDHVVKRADTWEISDSDADSDVESRKATRAVVAPLPAATWNCAGKEKCAEMDESCEGQSVASGPPAPTSPRSMKKRRKKRSPEEVEAERARLEARKLEREFKKEEKMRRQRQIVLEKQRRKEAAAAWKLVRPDQCLKRLTVCVDPGLLEDPGSDALLEALELLECKYRLEPQAVPCTITWKREIPNGTSDAEEAPEKAEEEREVLLLLEPGDFLKRLYSVLQSTGPAGLRSMANLSQLFPSSSPGGQSAKALDVVVIGLEAYQCWHHGDAMNPEPEEQSGHRSQPGPELSMTQLQMEEALVALQLWGNVGVLFLETWPDLVQHVSAVTRAIAQRPYKKHLERQPFSFSSAGRWASGIRVREDGRGLREVWCRQIQQFSRAGPAVAAAVARQHPSPHLLLQEKYVQMENMRNSRGGQAGKQ
ncbi:probable crossover junction endonuclease EME2 isoform X2 [Sphaerodactylus townsendi]|uniref:probable crossover junction endonuclease EME2 isoform X2 n=1 Tax=Sphaerodactylus townsendi TaxID=933632 RepID=UPI002026958A|nr:probable crossover junction endonuclease EME2 isoform X2 [Sphaerodactylus townsendi]